MIYDAYEELIGSNNGKIFVEFVHSSDINNAAGTASNGANRGIVNLSENYFRSNWSVARLGTSGYHVLMHEMAHVFENKYRDRVKWSTSTETFAELLVAYGAEKFAVQYGNNVFRREEYRQKRYNESLEGFKRGNLPKWSVNGYSPSVHRMYLFGLLDKVGWDTYKKVFRSYGPAPNIMAPREPHVPVTVYTELRDRDFFDRLEYFSGKPGVLRTLPDRGRLLDQHFNINVANKPYLALDPRTGLPKNQSVAQVGAQTPPPQTPTTVRAPQAPAPRPTTPQTPATTPPATRPTTPAAPATPQATQQPAQSRLSTLIMDAPVPTRTTTPGGRRFVNEEIERINRN